MTLRTLAPCPSSPNCVSTQAQDQGHAIAPFRYRKSRAEAKEALKDVIRSLPRTKLVEEDESYLHYEFTSLLLRFVDDVEFLFDDEAKTIHFRSASRTGYGDLGRQSQAHGTGACPRRAKAVALFGNFLWSGVPACYDVENRRPEPMGFKRKGSRVEVSRGGRLQRGALSAPCKVLDVSETGVRIESRLFVKSGDALQLVIELDQGRTLSCGLQVIHVRSPKFGAKITSISPEDRERLAHIFDDHVQTSFSRR